MGQQIKIDKDNLAVLLFSNKRNDWEDKTMSITAMYVATYHGTDTGYNVYFRGAEKKFFYKKENVRIIEKIKSIDISKLDVYVEDNLIDAIKVDEFRDRYYRILTAQKDYFSKAVQFESNNYRDIFKYYNQLAEYAGAIADHESPLYFLSQNYKRIDNSVKYSVLKDYLQGKCRPMAYEELLILPFDFNQSQVKAIDSALKNNISVIEGPPGTGKTQTILNLIANILYAGKNCVVISNNNTAIENVYEKLQEEKLDFIAACLGNRTNVQGFFDSDQQETIKTYLLKRHPALTAQELKKARELSERIKKIQDLEVETSVLESQLLELKNEKRHFDEIVDEEIIINSRLSSTRYIELIIRLQSSRKLWFFERWMHDFRYKVKIASIDCNKLLRNAEKLYYQTRISELIDKIDSNKAYLNRQNKNQVSNELKKLYRKSLEHLIYKHYQKNTPETFYADSYKRDYENFLLRYPVILSTSQSLQNNAPAAFMFDYVIIDEASQGDLLSSMLAISCARNLIVVGDSRQLQQIDDASLFEQSDKLAQSLDIPQAYRYPGNSILKSVKEAVKDVPVTLLKEHYRCAPDIINFCNKMFYEGELVAMTKNSGKHIEIVKTVAGNHARSNPYGSGLYNQREIDEIGNVLQGSLSKNVGVITPFRYQADLISKRYTSQVEADTIHKFQGRQKEEIIMSFVVNSLEQDPNGEKKRLNDFVTNSQLLNVAISRGQNKVTAIIADKIYHSENNAINDFVKYAEYLYGSEITRESTVTSVFDLLYSEYSNILINRYKNRPREHKTELLMYDLINELLQEYSYIGFAMHTRLNTLVQVPGDYTEEEKRYILHPWTHVDFLFYNKVSKEKLFVLEVDGIRFHEQNKKQAEHDRIKDRILQDNQIAVYRFMTNQANEKQRLKDIINGFRR